MLIRATAIWLAILGGAIANGAFRQGVLIPRLGEEAGHVLSTIMLSAVVLMVTWLSLRWIGPAGPADAWKIGLFWVLLTVGFEFLAGHYVFGTPWTKLLADYNVAEARIWVLVLITTFFAPVVTRHFSN